jgi:hypothetical protein
MTFLNTLQNFWKKTLLPLSIFALSQTLSGKESAKNPPKQDYTFTFEWEQDIATIFSQKNAEYALTLHDSIAYVQRNMKYIHTLIDTKGEAYVTQYFTANVLALHAQYITSYASLTEEEKVLHATNFQKIEELFSAVGMFSTEKITSIDSTHVIETWWRIRTIEEKIAVCTKQSELDSCNITMEQLKEIITYQDSIEVKIAVFSMTSMKNSNDRLRNLKKLRAYYDILVMEKENANSSNTNLKPIRFDNDKLTIAKSGDEVIDQITWLIEQKMLILNSPSHIKNWPYKLLLAWQTGWVVRDITKDVFSANELQELEDNCSAKELYTIWNERFSLERAKVLEKRLKKQLAEKYIEVSTQTEWLWKIDGPKVHISIVDGYGNTVLKIVPWGSGLDKYPLSVPEDTYTAPAWTNGWLYVEWLWNTTVHTQESVVLSDSTATTLTVRIWDDWLEDGDMVYIVVNGKKIKPLKENKVTTTGKDIYKLQYNTEISSEWENFGWQTYNEPSIVEIPLDGNDPSYSVVFFYLSEWRICPCTVAVEALWVQWWTQNMSICSYKVNLGEFWSTTYSWAIQVHRTAEKNP